jgi:UDP-N-acetylmuramoyl-tripeptide--D-alanyl-D-alanine ligase
LVLLDDIVLGLEQAVGAKGRLNFIQQCHLLIDDTYNANPTSMRAVVEVLGTSKRGFYDRMGDIGES